MAIDRIQPLKIEGTDTGGTDEDLFPTAADRNEDFVDCRGVAIQNDTSNDDNVKVSRDASNNLDFTDTVAGTKTLSRLDDTFHTSDSNEINALSEKVSPSNNDVVVIEDSASSFSKKKAKVSNLPGGGGAGSPSEVSFTSVTSFLVAHNKGQKPLVQVLIPSVLDGGWNVGGWNSGGWGSGDSSGQYVRLADDLYTTRHLDENKFTLAFSSALTGKVIYF